MGPIVLWDVMGTLVHDPFFLEMPAFFDLSFDAMLAEKHPQAWIEFELGRRTQEEFLREFFADGRAFDHQGFVDMVRASYRWLPSMEDVLAELASKGSEMHAFSNYPVWYQFIEDRLQPSRYLEWSFVSCRTGIRKPDSAAYRRIVDQLGVPPERFLFIDDRQSNCDAARQIGMNAVRFTDATTLRRSLAALGLL